jgi:SAM-dependent methyltransferase
MPHDRVLDVGCGCGRMAASILPYRTSGVYEGFDVIPSLVDWCRANIVPLYPTARFQQMDLYNKTYIPQGTIQPKDFRFPYGDNAFDFTFLTSVFTHMPPPDVVKWGLRVERAGAPHAVSAWLWVWEGWK